MFCDLAGQESERALLGEFSMGAKADMEHWYYLARIYLKSGCTKLLYFPSPESDWEEKANRKSLEILLDKQRKILSRFFKENLHVLKDLADTLSQRERLKAADLKPFLEKVVSTPGMPTVLKEYSPHI
jgi:ATP-dependent Zn protease